jgi:hypothetical protein
MYQMPQNVGCSRHLLPFTLREQPQNSARSREKQRTVTTLKKIMIPEFNEWYCRILVTRRSTIHFVCAEAHCLQNMDFLSRIPGQKFPNEQLPLMLGDIHALFAAEPQTKVEELLES